MLLLASSVSIKVKCESLVSGITKEQALRIADKLGFNESKELLEQAATQITNIYKLFLSIDALQVLLVLCEYKYVLFYIFFYVMFSRVVLRFERL